MAKFKIGDKVKVADDATYTNVFGKVVPTDSRGHICEIVCLENKHNCLLLKRYNNGSRYLAHRSFLTLVKTASAPVTTTTFKKGDIVDVAPGATLHGGVLSNAAGLSRLKVIGEIDLDGDVEVRLPGGPGSFVDSKFLTLSAPLSVSTTTATFKKGDIVKVADDATFTSVIGNIYSSAARGTQCKVTVTVDKLGNVSVLMPDGCTNALANEKFLTLVSGVRTRGVPKFKKGDIVDVAKSATFNTIYTSSAAGRRCTVVKVCKDKNVELLSPEGYTCYANIKFLTLVGDATDTVTSDKCSHPKTHEVPCGIGPSANLMDICCVCGEEVL